MQVRLAETERRFVVLDRDDTAFVLEGGLVSESERRFDERPTYALADPREVQARAAVFTQLWGAATPYRSFIDRERTYHDEAVSRLERPVFSFFWVSWSSPWARCRSTSPLSSPGPCSSVWATASWSFTNSARRPRRF